MALRNTGKVIVDTLRLQYPDGSPVLDANGVQITKPNVPSDPDYIPPRIDYCACPDNIHTCNGATVPPTVTPTVAPTIAPTTTPTVPPTLAPTTAPTTAPTSAPTTNEPPPTLVLDGTTTTPPTTAPTSAPTLSPCDLSEVVPGNIVNGENFTTFYVLSTGSSIAFEFQINGGSWLAGNLDNAKGIRVPKIAYPEIASINVRRTGCTNSKNLYTRSMISSDPSCKNEGTFTVSINTYVNDDLNITFNAANLSSFKWLLYKIPANGFITESEQILSGEVTSVTSNTLNIIAPNLVNGTYKLCIAGNSCDGYAEVSKTFADIPVRSIPSCSSSNGFVITNLTYVENPEVSGEAKLGIKMLATNANNNIQQFKLEVIKLSDSSVVYTRDKYFDLSQEFNYEYFAGLPTGNYKVKLTGLTCYGTATRDLTISTFYQPLVSVPLIFFQGESNAFGQAENSEVNAQYLGVKNSIKIWNRATSSFEILNITTGGNNTIGDSEVHNSRHGWEVAMGKVVGTSALPYSDVRIVKVGKSGAHIGQFNENATPRPNYWDDDIKPVIEASIQAIRNEGKQPDIFIWYSQGINDAISNSIGSGITSSQWETATTAHLAKMRVLTGENTPIILMKMFGAYATYTNSAIDRIVSANPTRNFKITTDDAQHQRYSDPAYHFNAIGAEACANDYMLITKNIVEARLSNPGTTSGDVTSAPTTGTPTVAPTSAPTSAPSGGNGSGGMTNILKTIAVNTSNEVYRPDRFPVIGLNTYNNPDLNKVTAKWIITWFFEAKNWNDGNRRLWDLGISGTGDYTQNLNVGFGGRCTEYIKTQNPDTGQSWSADASCNPAVQVNTFHSSLAFAKRIWASYGAAFSAWTNRGIDTNAEAFDEGRQASAATDLDSGNYQGTKADTLISGADLELDGGSENGNSFLTAFLLGMLDWTLGYVKSSYSSVLTNGGYISQDNYPNDAGVYTGNTAYNVSFHPDGRISIPERGISNKSAFDDKRILPGGEMSSYTASTYRHGTQYLKYANSGQLVTVNKFGANRNTEHTISRIIGVCEQQRYYVDNKMDGRRIVALNKILCDRGAMGREHSSPDPDTNPNLEFGHFDRAYSFHIGMCTFMHRMDWEIWDRNFTDRNLDGYNGALGVINFLHQRKNFGVGIDVSPVDLFPRLKPLLWKRELSVDNVNFYKYKGSDIISSSNIPVCSVSVTDDGYVMIAAMRPEKLEPIDFYVRYSVGGSTYTTHVLANNWETVNPAYETTALADLPLAEKDFQFIFLKVNVAVS